MEFARFTLTALVVISACGCSGCSESSAFVDYASLEAVAADFEAGANPAFRVDALTQPQGSDTETADPQRPEAEPPVADLPSADELVDSSVSTTSSVATEESAQQPADAASPAVAMQASSGTSAKSATDVEPASLSNADALVGAEVAAAEPSLLGTDPMAVQKPTEPREIQLLIPENRLRAEGEGTVRVSYDDIDLLKILNMEPVPVDAPRHFPEWLKQLHGQRIRIRGFMYPTFEATGLRGFTLARDNGICCFVRQPMIYDIIGVDLAKGVTTDYIDNKPFDVEGVFQIEPEADDMELYQLYRITDAKVLN